MQKTMNKIEALVSSYEGALLEKGIICLVSKKYFETKAQKSAYVHRSLIAIIFDTMLQRREKNRFYYQRNRIHSAVLKFLPADPKLIKKTECREYAYILYEISRHEEGFAPKEKIHSDEKILRKIEKRIHKILKKAEKKNAIKICQCTKADALRYFFLLPYGYMKKIVGYDRETLDIVFSVVLVAIFIIIFLLIFN